MSLVVFEDVEDCVANGLQAAKIHADLLAKELRFLAGDGTVSNELLRRCQYIIERIDATMTSLRALRPETPSHQPPHKMERRNG